MTAIAVKPEHLVTPSGNGAAAPQPVFWTLPREMLHLDEVLAALQARKDALGRLSRQRPLRRAIRHRHGRQRADAQ